MARYLDPEPHEFIATADIETLRQYAIGASNCCDKLRVELETTKYLVIQREIDVDCARREIERLQWTRDAVFADGFDAGGEVYAKEVAKLRDKVNELQQENEQLRKEVDKQKNDS